MHRQGFDANRVMPQSHARLSAGREQMNDSTQALALLAGANSIFYGDKLLTTENPGIDRDHRLFERLGLHPETREAIVNDVQVQAGHSQERPVASASTPLYYDAARID